MMYQMKYVAATELLNCQLPKSKQFAGPPFEYIMPEARKQYSWLIDELIIDIKTPKN